MTGRTVRAIASAVAFGVGVAAAGCTSFYEIPIETPIQAKLDVTPFQRVHVVGFIAGGTDDVDANLETVRLLRSQLRTRSGLRVIEADVLPLAEIAQEQVKDSASPAPTPGVTEPASQSSASNGTPTNGNGSAHASNGQGNAGQPAAGAQPPGTRIKDEKDLASYEQIFANVEYLEEARRGIPAAAHRHRDRALHAPVEERRGSDDP